jgi:uncharacterized protein
MIKLKISNLADGHHDFQFQGKIEEIDLSEPFCGNYEVILSLDKSARQIIINAGGNIQAQFECDRCGTHVNSNISVEF